MHIWIIEFKLPEYKNYIPYDSQMVSKKETIINMKLFQKWHPSWKFRVVKYIPQNDN